MLIDNGEVPLLNKLKQKNPPLIKSCLQQLYLNKSMKQLLHLFCVFTSAANPRLVCQQLDHTCAAGHERREMIVSKTVAQARFGVHSTLFIKL